MAASLALRASMRSLAEITRHHPRITRITRHHTTTKHEHAMQKRTSPNMGRRYITLHGTNAIYKCLHGANASLCMEKGKQMHNFAWKRGNRCITSHGKDAMSQCLHGGNASLCMEKGEKMHSCAWKRCNEPMFAWRKCITVHGKGGRDA